MNVPEDIRAEGTWSCFRLVVLGHATWTEVSTHMSIDDVDMLGRAADAFDSAVPNDEED